MGAADDEVVARPGTAGVAGLSAADRRAAGPAPVAADREMRRIDPDPSLAVEREEREFGAAERMTFFSDAVVAIAVTLLALNLPVPRGDSARQVLASLGDGWHAYLAFVISFAVIARYWTAHHATFRYLRRMDTRLLALNMVWLFSLVVLPWLTDTLAGDGSRTEDFSGQALRFALYAAGQVVSNAAFAAMLRHIHRTGLDHGRLPLPEYRQALGRALVVAAGFAVSIPVFFVWGWAWVLWVVVPVALGTLFRRLRAADPVPAGSSAAPRAM